MHEFNSTCTQTAIEPANLRYQTAVITVALTARDTDALWNAAALRGMSAAGSRLIDVIDVIGPREDPSILECVAMLAQPGLMPGCDLEDFDVCTAFAAGSQYSSYSSLEANRP
jgi:hypothetical protein